MCVLRMCVFSIYTASFILILATYNKKISLFHTLTTISLAICVCVCALLCLRTTTHARKLYAQHTIANALKKPIWAYLKCAHSYSPIRLVQFTHGIKTHAYTSTLGQAKWNFVWFTQWLYELLFKPKCLKWFSWSKYIHTDAFQMCMARRLFQENKKFDNHWKNTKAKSFL